MLKEVTWAYHKEPITHRPQEQEHDHVWKQQKNHHSNFCNFSIHLKHKYNFEASSDDDDNNNNNATNKK